MAETASMADLQLLPLDQPLLPAALAMAFDIPQLGTSAAAADQNGSSAAPALRPSNPAATASAFAVPRQPGAAGPAAGVIANGQAAPAGRGGEPAGPASWSSMTAALQAQQQQQQRQQAHAHAHAQAQTQAQAQSQAQAQQSAAAPQAAVAAAAPAGAPPFLPGPAALHAAPYPQAGHPYLSAAAGPGALPYNPYHSFPLMGAPGMAQPFNPYLGVMPPFPGGPGAAAAAAVPGMQLPPGMQMPPPGAAPSDYLAGAMQQPHLLYGHLQMPGQLPGHQMPGMRPPAALGLSHPLADPAEQKPGAGAAATQQQQQQQQQQLPQQGTSPTAAQAAAQGKVAMTKKPRVAWTPDLHARFVKAVTALGVDTAVPKQIMLAMNVEGLTRENVASHLQKFRLQLRRDKD